MRESRESEASARSLENAGVLQPDPLHRLLQDGGRQGEHPVLQCLGGLQDRVAGKIGAAGRIGALVERRRVRVPCQHGNVLNVAAQRLRRDLGKHRVQARAEVRSAREDHECAVGEEPNVRACLVQAGEPRALLDDRHALADLHIAVRGRIPPLPLDALPPQCQRLVQPAAAHRHRFPGPALAQ